MGELASPGPGAGPGCEERAHLLAPSHLVALTLFTGGIVAWPYWQSGISVCLGVAANRAARTLRMLPLVGPCVLARDVRTSAQFGLPSRLAADLIAVAILQLAFGYVVARGVEDWQRSVGAFDTWSGLLAPAWQHLTTGWHASALELIAAVSAIFMSDVQTEILRVKPLCRTGDRHLYAHLNVNVAAVAGAIVIPPVLFFTHGHRWLPTLAVVVGIAAYLNGSRQRRRRELSSLGKLSFYTHSIARQGGLLGATALIALSALFFNRMFDVNETAERGFRVGVFVDPALLQPLPSQGRYSGLVAQMCRAAVVHCPVHKLPTISAALASEHRVDLQFDVPLAKPGRFAFAVSKFAMDSAVDGAHGEHVSVAKPPACSYDYRAPPGVVRPVPMYRVTVFDNDGRTRFVFVGEPDVDDVRLGTVDCSFTDREPDVLESTYTRRRVTFAACCAEDAILPPDLNRIQSELVVDLRAFLSNSEVSMFGGRSDRSAPFEQRVRILSAAGSTEVRDSPAQRELTAEWTERGTPERRDFILIVTGSLLGLAFVGIVEWLRPHVTKLAARPPAD